MLRLGYDERELEQKGALWTAREIGQQPETLVATDGIVTEMKDRIAAFVRPYLSNPLARVILTGAGTSAFIGECLAPFLDAQATARVEAVATTDIVSSPFVYLRADTPTLLVSFGRSGNSPESKGAIEIADKLVADVSHLVITCNAEGAIAGQGNDNRLTVLLPDAAHDRSFAMTSSFTAMMYAAWAALAREQVDLERISEGCANILQTTIPMMQRLAAARFDRVVYLGSGPFKGLAREAALKLMELTDGKIPTSFDSPLGFRHGPKTVVTDRTMVMLFMSNDPLTRAYDMDLRAELIADSKAAEIVTLSAIDDIEDAILVPGMADAKDPELLYPYIIAPQIYGLLASLDAGLTPDNPNVSGTVNRVVQGVRLHACETV
ncbi:SIS domain-containing protein [Erythrobacter sp. 3-20A1M]|uniref:SIS domain-containing protein n=1 Tax=Erythrobacter sp. 3-20A1M TaxID=2653850 RepID=UPI001BFC4DFB|nr:SIS domain-containing protein [Erythrobacter sp. 3-20A1M]QWC56126.1 SIS domain-containing protein [Erythrobacter sp. 3-20A1M]